MPWENSKGSIDNTAYRGGGFAICVKKPLVKMLSIPVLDFYPFPNHSGELADDDTEAGPAS